VNNLPSKKLQTTIEEPMLTEIEEVMNEEKFYETSEFVKHCIRHYLIYNNKDKCAQTPLSTEMSASLFDVVRGEKGMFGV